MTNQHTPATQNESTDHPISDYYDDIKKSEIAGYEMGIKKARTALFVTAALIFAGELITVSMAGLPISSTVLVIALVEAGIFVGLALWTKTKPYTAIITGLIIFVGLWVLAIIIAGAMGAVGGIVVRIIIIFYLAGALKHAKAWEQAKKSH